MCSSTANRLSIISSTVFSKLLLKSVSLSFLTLFDAAETIKINERADTNILDCEAYHYSQLYILQEWTLITNNYRGIIQ